MPSPSLAERVDAHAAHQPDAPAFIQGDGQSDDVMSWAEYAGRSDRIASALAGLGTQPGARVAIWLPDGPGVHAAMLGVEKAGCVIVGIGPKAGRAELIHLLHLTGAEVLISRSQQNGLATAALVENAASDDLALRHHIEVARELAPDEALLADGAAAATAAPDPRRRLDADALWLLNSTSGTTGLPKCVTHAQARWLYFHELAVDSGELDERDRFLSALPAPFGFGIWTAHVSPTVLGAPTVVMARFDPDELVRQIEKHRVSVLAAVSTQFIMMLESPELEKRDLSSLRALYTGGEAVPYDRAKAFEERTGAQVLQFYGSNETGALSYTTTRDPLEKRISTAGRIIEGMQVRLYDEAGRDVTASGRGQPACKGPATSMGYYRDEEANAKLYTEDGWMLTGDIATLDADGFLEIVGRTADFIIRGGKNISGPVVEQHVASHPAVALAAAVAMPDPIFGERVCAYVELRPGASLGLDELLSHLAECGVGKENWPERLEVLDALPRASGGKVAKGELRADIRARLAAEAS